MRNGVRTRQGEALGLVGLDGVEEGGVVGGAVGGDLAVEEIDVAGSGDDGVLGAVAGGEGGVVAIDDRSGGDFDAGTRGEVEGQAGVYVERGAQIDGASGGAGLGFGGYFRDAELRQQSRYADWLF